MRHAIVGAALVAMAGGCAEATRVEPDPGGGPAPWIIPLTANRDLDLLFVIDNSGSMAGEQASLAANFPSLLGVLDTIQGGRPDLHLGILSSDVGAAGQTGITGCVGNGDDGDLRVRPGCPTLDGSFISDLADASGGRTTNYSGDLSALFSCMANLGTGGCGYEMHLESAYRALQPGKNPGFYRPDAHLAIVIIADEDDCSTELGAMFGDPTAGLGSPLGPRTSFRCFEFGTTCDQADPRAFGAHTGCRPNPGSPYLYSVDKYIDFLAGLKYDPSLVMVAGIVGVDDELHRVNVVRDPLRPDWPAVGASCWLLDPGDPYDGATPPIRIAEVVRHFGSDARLSSICSPTLSLPLADIGLMIKRGIRDPCLRDRLRDVEPIVPGLQPDCSVLEVDHPRDARRREAVLAACDPSSARPCWRFAPNPAECPDVAGNLAIDVDHGAGPPPAADAVLEVRCARP